MGSLACFFLIRVKRPNRVIGGSQDLWFAQVICSSRFRDSPIEDLSCPRFGDDAASANGIPHRDSSYHPELRGAPPSLIGFQCCCIVVRVAKPEGRNRPFQNPSCAPHTNRVLDDVPQQLRAPFRYLQCRVRYKPRYFAAPPGRAKHRRLECADGSWALRRSDESARILLQGPLPLFRKDLHASRRRRRKESGSRRPAYVAFGLTTYGEARHRVVDGCKNGLDGGRQRLCICIVALLLSLSVGCSRYCTWIEADQSAVVGTVT